MAERILTADLKPGMIVTSRRTSTYVYSFGTDLSRVRMFGMKGKAIVLQPLTKVRFQTKRSRYNSNTKIYITRDSYTTKNMLLLSHYKHGIVMYFAHFPQRDCKWRLIKEKEPIK